MIEIFMAMKNPNTLGEEYVGYIYLYNGTQILIRAYSNQMHECVFMESSYLRKPNDGDIKLLTWE